jgi:two-component system response regulator NreC
MTTIVLATDHALVREGLRILLGQDNWLVAGEATDGLEAVALASQLQPNVLIVDLLLPRLSGLEVIRQVGKRMPRTQIIALSMYVNASYVLAVLRKGAAAYVLKEAISTDIIQAIHEVVAGRRYLSPPLSQYALDAYIQKAKGAPLDPYETLTTREREVLRLAAQGGTTPMTAKQLSLSPPTIEIHRTNLMRKLGLRTQSDLIRYARQRGISALHE